MLSEYFLHLTINCFKTKSILIKELSYTVYMFGHPLRIHFGEIVLLMTYTHHSGCFPSPQAHCQMNISPEFREPALRIQLNFRKADMKAHNQWKRVLLGASKFTIPLAVTQRKDIASLPLLLLS